MKRLLPIVFFAAPFFANGSHLAGGEFQMKHISGNVYKITLILYFDLSHGHPGARDPSAAVRIFRASDNAAMKDVTLQMTDEHALSATMPVCMSGEFYLSAIYYTAQVTLDPATFNHPAGYYVAWERCCRNYGLDNIYSEEPNSPTYTGKYAGQTFLMHFPPIVVGASPFRNSSPRMLLPTLDWATVGKHFVQDYSSIDDDGDSLVYSLTTPLSTHTSDALQPAGPGPKPYPTPLWKPGYGPSNLMQGNPDLIISSEGRLTVTPTHQGSFAFAVRVEEFRNKIKIGEVIRDFQFHAKPGPLDNDPPQINFRLPDGSTTKADRNLTFSSSDPADLRCLKVTVTDPDVQTYPLTETVQIRAIPIGFNKSMSNILPTPSGGNVSWDHPTIDFTICFDKCPPAGQNNFRIGILAFDDECSIPASDTIYVNVTINVGDYCQTQTINFPQPSDVLRSDGQVSLVATASSGLPLIFSSTSLVVASINSSQVAFQASGRATIKAEQPGNEKFFPAEPVTRSFCINPLPPTITLEQNSAVIVLSSGYETIWYRNGIQITNGPTPWIEVQGLDGEFTARVMADDCLSEPSNSILISAIDESSKADFNVFPNPGGDQITIQTKSSHLRQRLEISTMSGVVLIKTDVASEPVFIGDLASGIYFVKVLNDDGFKVKKLFKK